MNASDTSNHFDYPSLDVSSSNLILNPNDYQEIQIITPDDTDIQAFKYIGNNTPSPFDHSPFLSAVKIKGESNYYNCHGFAWYLDGAISGYTESSTVWIDDYGVLNFAQTGCYTQILAGTSITVSTLKNYYSQLNVGDIVVYLAADGDPLYNVETRKHSAVITAKSSNHITVKSKWGEYGVYSHYVEDSPYSQTLLIVEFGRTVATDCAVEIYRKSHIHAVPSISPALTSTNTYTYPYLVDGKTLCDCGRSYDANQHVLVHLHGTLYKCSLCGAKIDTSVSPNHSTDEE